MEKVKKYIDAPSKYKNINDFIKEFTHERNTEFEVNWGMDFIYKGKEYHFARYPAEDDILRRKFEQVLGYSLKNYMYELILNEYTPHTIFSWDKITILGHYKDINDVLKSTVIDNKTFEEILLSDEIIIVCKD